ncbi:fatty acyl-CoA reductase wat-like isoform X2 [Coccinella septempunctata]|uniref:fatty acyl-CoA reductase wat-like isoform X2 n=1 Tax=Coccinella septempunctata TaxID=41139 RepID=UPI001D077EBE|nr:fatty acyl-CoA reductase wat-like isoform X2 [Coccinella septempunctata]
MRIPGGIVSRYLRMRPSKNSLKMNYKNSPRRYYKRVNELKSEESRIDLSSFLKPNDVVHCKTEGSVIAEFFKGKSVFITGGTGFLGKLIIEKLTRSCKDIDKIYILIREKKNKDFIRRTEELLNGMVFSEVKKVQPDFQRKIIPLRGDISLPNLGLNEADQETIKNEVHVIFHVAATVKLDEKLCRSVKINIEATIDLVNLAKTCKNLMSLVYVSTAYSNSIREVIEEKIYEPTVTDFQILKMTQSQRDISDEEEKRILGEWKNSYVMTKNIAEHVIKTHGSDLPVCIFRPAIVTNTFKEPLKGYVDNYYGTIGVLANNYAGVLRTANVDGEVLIENVPADFVVNGIIVAAYKNHILGRGDIRIYNYVSSEENPIKTRDLHDLAAFYGHQTPTIKSLWYPCNTINSNFYVHAIFTIFLHFVPAFFFDLYLTLMGKKPWMMSFYKKIYRFNKSIAWFASNEWKFSTNNVQQLWNELPYVDKRIFPFSMSKENFNWNEYLSQVNLGIRLYLLQDELHTMTNAIRKHKNQYYLHIGVKYGVASAMFLSSAIFFGRIWGL